MLREIEKSSDVCRTVSDAVQTTAQMADNVLGGKMLKESAKHRTPTGTKNAPWTKPAVGIWYS